MSETDLQRSSRYLRCLLELVEDQERRVAYFQAMEDADAEQRAQSLLTVLEQCLVSARYAAAQVRGGGAM